MVIFENNLYFCKDKYYKDEDTLPRLPRIFRL